MDIKVVSVNISEKKGTIKKPVSSIVLDEKGIVGDAHAGKWHRQVSLLGRDSITTFEESANRSILPGEFAENIITEGIDLTAAHVLDRFTIGEVVLEMTQLGKKCHGDSCAIFREVGSCIMPKEGIFCRVVHGGEIKSGDAVVYTPSTLNVKIITLSDRAANGEYTDRSGPQIETDLAAHFNNRPWNFQCERALIPDDAAALKRIVEEAVGEGIDILFTTGGTGIGPRDITPDTILPMLEKTLPGIMEYIRVKYGETIPSALLSRSVAGLIGQTQIYTLPGSVKAVKEYTAEILRTLEHTLLMLHGIDAH